MNEVKIICADLCRRTGKQRAVKRLLLHAITVSLLALTTMRAGAEGFRNPPPGAFNLGRAGGRIAQIDDSSAVQQNPANLVDLAGTELQFAPTIVYIRADFSSPNVQSASTENPWKFLPNLFAAMPLFDGTFAVGLGITTPYGLGSEWNQNSSAFQRPSGVLRYQAPSSADLTTVNFNPTIATKLGDHLSIGAGVDVMWSEVTLKQFYPWFLATGNFGDPDGHIKATGDGVGVGANLGMTWKITERQRLAVTYRSPIQVNYEGSFRVDNVPAALGGGTMSDKFKTNIKFPTTVAAGYGIELTDSIRLETDVEWLQFSNFKNLPLDSTTAQTLGLPPAIPQNWKDTFTVGIGGDWRFAPDWVLRAGYQFYQSPVPDKTFSPAIPDADQNVFTIGLGYKYKEHSLEAAYGLDFYNDRNIQNNQNPAFDGKYSFTVHLFSLAYRYSF